MLTERNSYMYNKILSIIIAAYNVEEYIDKALKSCVISQEMTEDYEDYEVIIINDGSTDKTAIIAQKYVDTYPQVFRLINKENGGYGSAINKGISEAEGTYIKLLDGDDWYNTKALQVFIKRLKTSNADMVLTNYARINTFSHQQKHISNIDFEDNKKFSISELQAKNKNICMHEVCYKTSIFKQNKLSLREHCYYTDAEYVVYAIPYVNIINYYDIDLYQYRLGLTVQSVSIQGLTKHFGEMRDVIDDLSTYTERQKNNDNIDYMEQLLARDIKNYYYCCCLLNNKEYKEALICYDKILKEKYPKRYLRVADTKMKLMRLSRYTLYDLISSIERKKYEWRCYREK